MKQEETSATADDGDEKEASAVETPVARADAQAPKSSSGITMLDMSFADLNVNRNRRQNMFAADEAENEEDSE